MEQEFMVAPVCPHCGINNVAMYLAGKYREGLLDVSFWRCGNCGHGIVLEKDHVPLEPDASGLARYKVIEALYPPVRPAEAPEGTPEHVARFYRAAEKILRRGDPDELPSAATNARHAIEQALIGLGVEDGTLAKKIADAQSRGLIAPVLGAWATEIRSIGNEGTHGKDPDANDIAQAVYFAEMLLVCLYELPAMIEDRKARKAARQ